MLDGRRRLRRERRRKKCRRMRKTTTSKLVAKTKLDNRGKEYQRQEDGEKKKD